MSHEGPPMAESEYEFIGAAVANRTLYELMQTDAADLALLVERLRKELVEHAPERAAEIGIDCARVRRG